MNFRVMCGRITGADENGLSAGQLTTDQIFDYLENCTDWLDECVFPLAHELCDRLKMDFDEYDTYDELYDEAYNKMLDLIEKEVSSDFLLHDCLEGRIGIMTPEEATERLKLHSEENPGIPIWPDEYINAYNNQIVNMEKHHWAEAVFGTCEYFRQSTSQDVDPARAWMDEDGVCNYQDEFNCTWQVSFGEDHRKFVRWKVFGGTWTEWKED